MNKLVKLTPFFKQAIWGTESWICSTHPNGSSLVGSEKLSDLVELNYLTKIISTHQNLSIQVHPSVKNESWLILDHIDNAGIYLGFKEGVTKKEFKNALLAGAQIDKFLNFIPVKKGDFFFVPAGAIHAIGENIKLLEIQESSDITYRVWDWNRVDLDGKPRQLHIDSALEVLDFNFSKPMKKNVFESKDLLNELFSFKAIKIDVLRLSKNIELNLKKSSSIILLDGQMSFNDQLASKNISFIADGDVKVDASAQGHSLAIIIR